MLSCGQDTLISVISIRNCDSTSVRCNVYVPNIFTPDSDGYNDGFQPLFSCDPDFYEYIIYNNWGEQVFKSIDPTGIWDGRFRNSDCPSGVYVYVLKYRDTDQKIHIVAKDVLLLR